jgi:uncharacterized protein (TIGR02588 family)
MSRENGKPEAQSVAIPPAEWAVAAIGATLVLAALVVLIWDGLYGSHSPPQVSLAVGEIIRVPDGYLVEVQVTNRGAGTAEALGIRGSLARWPQDHSPESAEAELAFLPGRSHRKVGLYFRSDPRKGQLSLYAVGFSDP